MDDHEKLHNRSILSERAKQAHSFTPYLTLQSDSKMDDTIISPFIGAPHYACSYGPERVANCINSIVTEPSGPTINQS